MGTEIGWYLRFKPGYVIRAKVQRSTMGQLENLKAMFPEWEMTVADQGEYLTVHFRDSGSKAGDEIQ